MESNNNDPKFSSQLNSCFATSDNQSSSLGSFMSSDEGLDLYPKKEMTAIEKQDKEIEKRKLLQDQQNQQNPAPNVAEKPKNYSFCGIKITHRNTLIFLNVFSCFIVLSYFCYSIINYMVNESQEIHLTSFVIKLISLLIDLMGHVFGIYGSFGKSIISLVFAILLMVLDTIINVVKLIREISLGQFKTKFSFSENKYILD